MLIFLFNLFFCLVFMLVPGLWGFIHLHHMLNFHSRWDFVEFEVFCPFVSQLFFCFFPFLCLESIFVFFLLAFHALLP